MPVLTRAKTSYTTAADVDAQVRAALKSGALANASLYALDAGLLASLAPDVILTQDLCEVCSIDLATVRSIAARLAKPAEIVSLNPLSFEGVLDDLLTIGRAVNLQNQAREAMVGLRERFYAAADFVVHFAAQPTVAFLEWTDPLYVGGHWTPQLIERAGGVHPLNPTVAVRESGAAAGPVGASMATAGRSVRVPPEVLAASRPEALVICPCGVGLEQVRREVAELMKKDWFAGLPAVRGGRVALVDGNQMFNRPGPRLVEAFAFLVGWLNDRPEVIPGDFPWEPFGP